MTALTKEERAALRALDEKATPGPWRVGGGVAVEATQHGRRKEVCDWIAYDDATFIVAMRNALPALLDAADEADRLRERRFRIMDGPSIPWSLIAPHERQALENHDQTLERLNERGGLSILEAVAVLTDRHWRVMRGVSDADARAQFDALTSPIGAEVARLRKRMDDMADDMAESRDFEMASVTLRSELALRTTERDTARAEVERLTAEAEQWKLTAAKLKGIADTANTALAESAKTGKALCAEVERLTAALHEPVLTINIIDDGKTP